MNKNFEHRIRVENYKREYSDWCREHLDNEEWYMKIAFLGPSASYFFEREEYLTAFKLAVL